MSLESNIAALVAASTKLTQAVNITKATVEATRDSTIAKEAPVTTARDAVLASTTAATTDATTTGTKLAAAAADYATQQATKGLAAVRTSADAELKDRLHRRDPARHPFRGARPSLVMDFVRRECHRNNAAGNLEPVDLNTFMTFTRGSTATYVGPDGLIKEAAVNTPRYGYDPVTGEALGLLVEEQRTNFLSVSDTYWWAYNGAVYVLPCVALAPNGTLSAARVIGTSLAFGNGVWRSCTISATGTITISVYIKAVATGGIRLSAEGGSINNGSSCEAYFNPLSGYSASGVTAGSTASSVNVGGGWYRLWLTAPATSTTDVRLVVYGWDNTMFTDFYIWGAQLEAGSFPTSYIPTPATFTGRASTKTYFDSNGVLQTADSGEAVTDYGYVDGRWVSKGLSLEGQATNFALQSSTVEPIRPTASVELNVLAAPDGTMTADKLIASQISQPRCEKNIAVPAVDTKYTWSFFAKRGSNDFVSAGHYSGVSANGAIFNLATGVVVSTTSAGCVGRITPCDNGWFRCSITFTVLATSTYNYFKAIQCDGALFDVGVIGGYVYLWGFQIETGPVATSYIPTTTAQVTRAADTSTSAQVTRADESAALSTMANWYNRDNSTFCVGAQRHVSAGSNSRILTGPDATQNELIGICPGNEIESYDGVGLVCAPAGWNNLTPMRAGIVLGRAARKISGNGANVKSGAASSKLVDLSAIKIWPYTLSQPRAGYIRQLTYFPRQLSDADLQALTILED
jgi:hypothetical protein